MRVWTTQSGEDIKVKDMTTSHIENCIKYLERQLKAGNIYTYVGDVSGDDSDLWWGEEIDNSEDMKNWIRTFKRELKKRPTIEEYYQ